MEPEQFGRKKLKILPLVLTQKLVIYICVVNTFLCRLSRRLAFSSGGVQVQDLSKLSLASACLAVTLRIRCLSDLWDHFFFHSNNFPLLALLFILHYLYHSACKSIWIWVHLNLNEMNSWTQFSLSLNEFF